MNRSQLEAQEKQLLATREKLKIRVKSTPTADTASLHRAYAEVQELKADEAALEAARAQLDSNEAFLKRMGGLDGGGLTDSPPDALPSASFDDNMRLHFGAKMAKGLVERKSLASTGAAIVGQEFVPNPVIMGRPATGLLDVIQTRTHDTPLFAYLRQNARTNNAAVVADYAVKPTSTYGVTRVENQLQVIAHLSEGIPTYWLNDNPTLTAFVQDELQYGLRRAIEAKVLSDIDATTGIGGQTFVTGGTAAAGIPLNILRAMTTLEIAGYTPEAIVMHPSDFETVELALSTQNAVEHMGLPYDSAKRLLYGIPIATAIVQTVGTALVLPHGAVAVDCDSGGVQLRWSDNSNATDFSENLFRARLETRSATSLFVPGGIVKVAQTGS